MVTMSTQEVRNRLAKIANNIFSEKFRAKVTPQLQRYDDAQIPEMLLKNRDAVIALISSGKYESANAEISCCFYYRYWMTINNLAAADPNLPMGVPESNKDFLKFLLIELVER